MYESLVSLNSYGRFLLFLFMATSESRYELAKAFSRFLSSREKSIREEMLVTRLTGSGREGKV